MGPGIHPEVSVFAILLSLPFLFGAYKVFKASSNLFIKTLGVLTMVAGVLWILLFTALFIGMVFDD